MAKVFIDLGAYNGDTITAAMTQPFDKFVGFEPNPETFAEAKKLLGSDPRVTLFNAAAGAEDGEATFFVHHTAANKHGRRQSKGSSLFQRDKPGTIDPIKCQVIDFSRYLLANHMSDEVSLKVDIEGAEYDVLEKMFADGSIACVKELRVEYHQTKIPAITLERHNALVERLKNIPSF